MTSAAAHSADRPALSGLVALEIDGAEAGAIAGMILADHGATVIKIEPPEGAPERARSGAEAWDRGKSSVAIDPGERRRGRGPRGTAGRG